MQSEENDGVSSEAKAHRGGGVVNHAVTIVPRRKGVIKRSKKAADELDSSHDSADNDGGKKAMPPLVVTRSVLESCFGLSRDAAALKLGMSATALKKVCRQLGVAKWPYTGLKQHCQQAGGSNPSSAENGSTPQKPPQQRLATRPKAESEQGGAGGCAVQPAERKKVGRTPWIFSRDMDPEEEREWRTYEETGVAGRALGNRVNRRPEGGGSSSSSSHAAKRVRTV